MKVDNKTVFRVIDYDIPAKEGESALPSKWEVLGEYKQHQEESLEKLRPKEYPQREECLYVCFSKENAYEWARIKYNHQNTYYIILTLEVSGDLFWLKANCYNYLRKNDTQEEFDQAAINYWNSVIEDDSLLTLDQGYEGLFVGKNKIIKIEYKNYINGKSFDIE